MEAICTPIIATAAVFVALIFLDLLRREFELLPGHGLFGIICVFLMTMLCQRGFNMVAWGLLLIPFVFLIIGWGIQATQPMSNNSVAATTYPTLTERTCSRCKNTHCRCPK